MKLEAKIDLETVKKAISHVSEDLKDSNENCDSKINQEEVYDISKLNVFNADEKTTEYTVRSFKR